MYVFIVRMYICLHLHYANSLQQSTTIEYEVTYIHPDKHTLIQLYAYYALLLAKHVFTWLMRHKF